MQAPIRISSLGLSCCLVPLSLLLVKASDEVILKSVIVEQSKDECEYNSQGFFETTDVSQPIKQVIGFPVYSVQIQIEFKRQGSVDIVKVLIWPDCVRLHGEYVALNLS